MKQEFFEIKENTLLAPKVYRVTLTGDTSGICSPGQFVNIKLDGFFLRRPISVCDWCENSLTLIYKTVGDGTEALAKMRAGEKLDLLVGLGNGYRSEKSGEFPLLIGGGVGVPPLYALCKRLLGEGKKPAVILGFNTASEIFYEDEFQSLGADVSVTTADGTSGIKGFVTDGMKDREYTYIYACGPLPMLKVVNAAALTGGQFSFEERMGCGFGACMGCSCKTTGGAKRICKDGPVLEREEIQWETLK